MVSSSWLSRGRAATREDNRLRAGTVTTGGLTESAGAIAVFIVGRWLISLVTRLMGAAMTRNKIDATVQRYMVSFITIALNIIFFMYLSLSDLSIYIYPLGTVQRYDEALSLQDFHSWFNSCLTEFSYEKT